ncbi:MAG: hypothetical protein JW808_06740 [Victivallales bacterium]|nr:hypothetical protein [Victivallales bacterium]
MAKTTYLEEIEKTYNTIEENFEAAYSKCADKGQKDLLASARDVAKKAFWQAVAGDLKSKSPLAERACSDLKKANSKMLSAMKHMDDAKAVISAVEQAVRLAAAVAAMAA